MKKYLAVFTGSPAAMDAWKAMDPGQREAKEKAGMSAWKEWATAHAKDIVDPGSPLGKTKQVSAKGIADIRNNMGAYTVVQADSQDAAAKMFEKHPHFMLFPGEAVDVMECLPMPEGVS
jgi:hypothetical protein